LREPFFSHANFIFQWLAGFLPNRRAVGEIRDRDETPAFRDDLLPTEDLEGEGIGRVCNEAALFVSLRIEASGFS
jgi:hypothetical protein